MNKREKKNQFTRAQRQDLTLVICLNEKMILRHSKSIESSIHFLFWSSEKYSQTTENNSTDAIILKRIKKKRNID